MVILKFDKFCPIFGRFLLDIWQLLLPKNWPFFGIVKMVKIIHCAQHVFFSLSPLKYQYLALFFVKKSLLPLKNTQVLYRKKIPYTNRQSLYFLSRSWRKIKICCRKIFCTEGLRAAIQLLLKKSWKIMARKRVFWRHSREIHLRKRLWVSRAKKETAKISLLGRNSPRKKLKSVILGRNESKFPKKETAERFSRSDTKVSRLQTFHATEKIRNPEDDPLDQDTIKPLRKYYLGW